MFFTLYRKYTEGSTFSLVSSPSNSVAHITPSGSMVNSEHIVYMDASPTAVDGASYYRIQVSGDPVMYYYISAADRDMLVPPTSLARDWALPEQTPSVKAGN